MIHTYLDDYSESELQERIERYIASPEFISEHITYAIGSEGRANSAGEYIQQYNTSARQLEQLIVPTQEKFSRWLADRHIVPTTPIDSAPPSHFEDYFIASAIIHKTSLPYLRNGWKTYHSSYTDLTLNYWSSEFSILENLINVASFDPETLDLGYAKLKRVDGYYLTYDSPSYHPFNLGVIHAVVANIISPKDTESVFDDLPHFKYAYRLTRRLQRDMKLDDDTLFRGLFCSGNEREVVIAACNKAFGMPPEGMKYLYYIRSDSQQFMEDILDGNPVTLKYPIGNHDLEHVYKKLAELFENVTSKED